MNFFENQDRARRKSALLLFYFAAAVLLIVLAVNLIAWAALQFGGSQPQSFWVWAQGANFWKFAGISLVVIGGGSLVQYLKLRSGGEAVAKMVGATPVELQTRDLEERRFINVVEEMSIAAGVVMPRLYIMEHEQSINAFVAGYQPNQAVMVVTRGTLRQLGRDELQGVVGHEFSHILNGDMRLNIRLVAILAGILLIGQLGEFLLRSTRHTSRSRDGAKAAPVFLIGGLGLMAIGYIGLFFGRLIKSAVSRQREFLADASSVQFTRNPQGIASALHQIRESSQGSLLVSTLHAEDMNHMCFGETVSLNFKGLFASHPPLDERIRAIDPLFLTKARTRKNQEKIKGQQPASPAPDMSTQAAMAAAFAPGGAMVSDNARKIVSQVGQLQPQHSRYAEELTQGWPEPLRNHIHSATGAPALVYAMLVLDMGLAERALGLSLLQVQTKLPLDLTALQWGVDSLPDLGLASRLPIVELCLPRLKQLEASSRAEFLNLLEELVRVDQRFTLFEWALVNILRKQLAEDAGRAQKVLFHSFKPVREDVNRVLAVLARVAGQNKEEIKNTCSRLMKGFSHQPVEAPAHCSLAEFSTSLNRLAALSPLLKQPLLESCADVVLQDGLVRVAEYELLRAVAEVLECPMPPLAGLPVV